MFSFFKKLFAPAADFKALYKAGAVIVDVRSAAEYQSGHVKGSLNLPLEQIGKQAEMLKKKHKAIITVCRSGARSAMAQRMLKGVGIDCYNGGAWDALQAKLK